jgi:hypothetical protein
MKTFHFTTVVSVNYIYKFLAMQESLEKHCDNYHIFVLCVDEVTSSILKGLPLKNITLIDLKDLEKDEILEAKNNRNYYEYCWTLKPFMLNYALKNYTDAEYFAHIDADLFFFADPKQIIEEDPNSSLFITDHNNSRKFLHTYKTSGIYNTGFVCCKNDNVANSAVDWWLNRCLEKCALIANVEEGLYGDQKYIEKWPGLFPNVHVVRTKGANVAQWNIESFYSNLRRGEVFVNNDKLIFYHFSGLSILSEDEFSLSTFYKINLNSLNYIYIPYIKLLSKYMGIVTQLFPDFKEGLPDRRFVSNVHYYKL